MKQRAFTFVEVLVALVIFAVAGAAVSFACANFLQAQHAASRRDATAADRQLARQALAAEPSRERAETWNEVPLPDNRHLRWRATIVPTAVADLFDATLEIELPAHGSAPEGRFTETVRLLRPTWSTEADRQTLRAAAMHKLGQRRLP